MTTATETTTKTDMRPGDVVRVHQKIQEGEKSRIQVFEGIVLARKHGTEAGATFTVRKVSGGVGVERVFPLHSPNIERIEIVKRPARTRRAKLYYIREKAAREQRKKMRHEFLRDAIVAGGTVTQEVEEEAPALEEETEETQTEAVEAQAENTAEEKQETPGANEETEKEEEEKEGEKK